MNFQKLKLKKNKVMELSSGIDSLPREETDNVAGGVQKTEWCNSNMIICKPTKPCETNDCNTVAPYC